MALGAPVSAGILRTALVEAGIGMATEAPIQAAVQFGRSKFGEEPSLSEGVTAVLAAGAGGFLFGGLLKAAGKAPAGVRALLQRSRQLPPSMRSAEVRAAAAYLERAWAAEEATSSEGRRGGRAWGRPSLTGWAA